MKERLRDMEAKVRSSNLHLTEASKGEEREVGEKHYLKIDHLRYFKYTPLDFCSAVHRNH